MKPRISLSRLSLISLAALATNGLQAQEGDPSLAPLFPIPDQVRQILDQRCVMCHGEVIEGEKEIREDLDLSSEAAIRETLVDLDTMLHAIEDDEMPHEAKLSYRLRRNPEMRQRLAQIKEEYEAKGEKEILLAWLKGKLDS